MLHVFHVDSGRMMTFDMSLALQSVEDLKMHVEKEFEIAADKQVLLISGGECLDPKKRVCSYSAGTDTNPIFLFSKSVIESPNPPLPSGDHGNEGDVDLKVREHCDMPASFVTIAKRAQLAQHLVELARKQLSACENLVHDQHLQQQGWSAVVANLEDISFEFRKRTEIFEKSFMDYIEERESYMKFLGLEDPEEDEVVEKREDRPEQTVVFSISPVLYDEFLSRNPPTHSVFNNDLKVLQRIPVLPALLTNSPQLAIEDSKTSEEEEKASTSDTSETGRENTTTLFDWISATDNKSTMDQLYEHCCKGLEQFDKKVLQTISSDISDLLKNASSSQMKEVKGLSERLSGLETLMREAKKFLKQQMDLAQSFANNQSRTNNTKDSSVLPDLCMSHKKQLQMMALNHTQLCDIRRRCTKAKEELSLNLYHRLKWVMFIEDRILETDQKLVIFHENLRRLRRHLEILQQIHLAPATYLCAVAEVVRRRSFSQNFLLWASELACHLLTIHNDEVTRRKDFQSQFEGHFLNSLFPGMEDLPPNFATQAPAMFDTALPKITQEDVDRLKSELPDLADNLNVPDNSALINFFLARSLTARKEEEETRDGDSKMGSEEVIKAVEDKLIQAVSDVGLASDLDRDILRGTGSEPCLTTAAGLPHLKDLDKGCESETDTEEFEKVGQSPLELNFDKNIPSPRPRTQDASTSTEDNLQISRSEHDRLKSVLGRLHQLAKEATTHLKSELSDLRTQVLANRTSAGQQCDSLTSSWENLIVLRDNKEKETLETMIKNHEDAINELRKHDELKHKQIEDLLGEKSTLESEILKSCENLNELQKRFDDLTEESSKAIEDLRRQLQEKDAEKEKVAKETSDRLIRDHKAELESIRARFKLMTMERSPSDGSLEKSVDFSNLSGSSPALQQMKKNFEVDKERAVSEALVKEREKWEKLLDIRTKEIEKKLDEEKELSLQNLAKKITEEKDKQIDVLMEREKNLNLECIKHKSTIQQLAESEAESTDVELLKKITALQAERDALAEELDKLRNKDAVSDMATSVAVCEAKVDVTTSPIKQKEAKKGMLSVESCKPGERVIVVWDKEHENYRVIQEKQHLYFLHSDYLEGLGLEVNDGEPNKHYCIGEVIDKEYCYARKSDNRYRVPKCTKFFRVKVRSSSTSAFQSRDVSQSLYQPSNAPDSTRMTQSQSVVASILEESALEDNNAAAGSDQVDSAAGGEAVASELVARLRDDCDVTAGIEQATAEQTGAHAAAGAAPQWPEKHFAEDSGIVDNIENVEEAMAALDDTLIAGDGQTVIDSERCGRNILPILAGLLFTKIIYEIVSQNEF